MVPFNSFSEFNKAEGGDIWFAFDESRPLACFAGIWKLEEAEIQQVKDEAHYVTPNAGGYGAGRDAGDAHAGCSRARFHIMADAYGISTSCLPRQYR